MTVRSSPTTGRGPSTSSCGGGSASDRSRRLPPQPSSGTRCYPRAVTAPTLDAEPACPEAVDGPRPGPDRSDQDPARRAPPASPTSPARRGTGSSGARRGRRRSPLGLPPRLVGRLRRQRPRADAGRRRCRRAAPARTPVAIVPLMHRHEVEPTDAITHTTIRHGADHALTPGPADREGHLLRGLLPRRLRDDPDGPGRPARRRRGPRRAASQPIPTPTDDHPDLGRRRPAPAALRRPVTDELAAAFGRARDERRLDPQPGARGGLPGRDPPRRRRLRRLPRHPRQEGAPRDPAQDPPCRGRRARSAWSRRPTRWRDLDAFIDLHQKRWGAERPLPADAGWRRRVGCSSAGCSSCSGPTGRSGCRS